MSIRSLVDSVGQNVTLFEPTETIDSVGSSVQTYSEGIQRRAYVSNSGNTTENSYGRTKGTQFVRVYFSEHLEIGPDWVLQYDNVKFRITSVQHPGMRKTGPLAYTYLDANSDVGADIE